MHIGRHIIQELVLSFGEPEVERWDAELSREELEVVLKHRERGRAHDVSLVILREDQLAVIRKPGYPAGGFRIPSGGVHPEESFLDGAKREALEETGLSVGIEDYLLQVHVNFIGEDGRRAKWTTHGLLARAESGELSVIDKDEIEEVRWMSWEELLKESNPLLRGSGRKGLDYRARLHEKLNQTVLARSAEGKD